MSNHSLFNAAARYLKYSNILVDDISLINIYTCDNHLVYDTKIKLQVFEFISARGIESIKFDISSFIGDIEDFKYYYIDPVRKNSIIASFQTSLDTPESITKYFPLIHEKLSLYNIDNYRFNLICPYDVELWIPSGIYFEAALEEISDIFKDTRHTTYIFYKTVNGEKGGCVSIFTLFNEAKK